MDTPPTVQNAGLASGGTITPAALGELVEKAMIDTGVNGASVTLINDGRIVYSQTFGIADPATGAPVTADTLFEAASMSKPMFGALVVDLTADGVIDLDAPLAGYMPHPDLQDDPRAAKLTARQVLTHQTGLPNWRSDNADGRLDIAFEPGTARRYSGEGYEYLADVLMHELDLDDRALDALFRQRIAAPAGSDDTYFVQDDTRVARKAIGYRDGVPFSGDIDYANDGFGAAYSIHATTEDYAKAMIGLMRGPSLDADEREIFFAPQKVDIAADDPERAMGLADWALGYGMYQLPIGLMHAHGGNNEGFTGMSGLIRDTGWGAVVFTNENQANDFTLRVFSSLVGIEPPPLP